MADIFRTMIIPAAQQVLAQNIATSVKPVEGDGMWVTPLSAVASGVPSHYISTGFISPEWESLMPVQNWELQDGSWVMTSSSPGDAATLHSILESVSAGISLAEVEEVFAAADVTMQEPFTAMERMGLVMVTESDPVDEPDPS